MVGRHLLAASNVVIGGGLLILAAAQSITGLAIAWTVLGVGMGLYDSAFATLTWLYGRDARRSITGITLIAGFASTIGWPLSALFLNQLGWRSACLIWAGLSVLLAVPVNWLTIRIMGCRKRYRNLREKYRRPRRHALRCQS
jgi:MFS family permease